MLSIYQRWGELIENPGASLLYFAFGYSLYGNASLFTFLKAHWKYYFLAGFIGFILYMILNVTESNNLVTDIYSDDITSPVEKEITELLQAITVSIKNHLCCFVFICIYWSSRKQIRVL